MVTEIELKAHVRDSEALRKILSGKAEPNGAFEKRDVYWFGPENSNLTVTKLRVRKEKRSFADGTEKSTCLVTYKAKEEYHGIEINEELEFEVEPAEVFEEFLKKAGLMPGAGKIKRGWAFVKGRITAELAEVEGLGWFIELEILIDAKDKNDETIKKTSETLLAFLDDIGVEREAIESRFYLDLLSSADQRT
jgi:adenylate cyclase class 2